VAEPFEVRRVCGVKRKAAGRGRRGDQKVHGSTASGLAAHGGRGGVNTTVGPSRSRIEWDGIEECLCSLQPLLAASALIEVIRRMRACRQLSKCDR